MSPEDLTAFLNDVRQRHGFVYGLVAKAEGQKLAESGDPRQLRWDNMVTQFFGTSEDIRNTYESLDGRILPVIKGQGEVVCAISRPIDGLLIALFHQDGRRDPDLFREVGEIAQELAVRQPAE